MDPLGKSDHVAVTLMYRLAVQVNQSKQPVRNFWKADYAWSNIQMELGEVDWGRELEAMNAADTWECIRRHIMGAAERNVPWSPQNRKVKKNR